MNRETRDKFTAGTDQANLLGGNACMETPWAVFQKLSEDFGPFAVDLFADKFRRLTQTFFGPGSPVGEEDALVADWSRHLRGKPGFGNPPYGAFVKAVLQKAKDEAESETSLLLLPMRATAAFHAFVIRHATDLYFCDKRITFYEYGRPRLTLNKRKGEMQPTAALFDSILVRFGPKTILQRATSTGPRVRTWAVPEHVSDHANWLLEHRSLDVHLAWLAERRAFYGEQPEPQSSRLLSQSGEGEDV